jgi:hypothetical protein
MHYGPGHFQIDALWQKLSETAKPTFKTPLMPNVLFKSWLRC